MKIKGMHVPPPESEWANSYRVPQETPRDSERRFTKADLLSFVGWYMSDGTLAPDEQDLADWDAAKVDKRRPRAWGAKYEALERENAGLRAALIAYASEFPLNGEGEPDVGSIHANLRALKADNAALRELLLEAREAIPLQRLNLEQRARVMTRIDAAISAKS